MSCNDDALAKASLIGLCWGAFGTFLICLVFQSCLGKPLYDFTADHEREKLRAATLANDKVELELQAQKDKFCEARRKRLAQ